MMRLRAERARMPANAARVLVVMLAGQPSTVDRLWWDGLTLMARADIGSGRLYPALGWLEDNGYIEAEWQGELTGGDGGHAVQHRRRLYRTRDYESENRR
jgi:DNA-binding PadR family transcriptional regulator